VNIYYLVYQIKITNIPRKKIYLYFHMSLHNMLILFILHTKMLNMIM